MATGTTENIDATTAANFVPELWSRKLLPAREAALLFADLVDRDYEADVQSFGDTIHVTSVTNLTAQSKDTSANAATIFETQTESATSITIGTWHYSAVSLETATARQVNRDLLETYAPKQGFALGLAIDDVLAGLVDDFSNNVGTLAVALTYEDVLRAQQYLDDADAPQDGRVIVVSPGQKRGFMTLDHFIAAEYRTVQGERPLSQKDALGSWLGDPVFVSSNVEGTNSAGHDNGYFQREAIALVVQMKPTTHMMFDINYLARKVAVEQLSGSREMRDDHGVFMKGL